MNVAAAIALAAASVNIASSVFHFAIARAPGWRAARTFAAIALTAGLYNITGLVFATDGLSNPAYAAAAQLADVLASLHCIAWLIYAFGGPQATPKELPRPIQVVVLASLAATAFFSATGLHLSGEVIPVNVRWAGVTYHYPAATPAGHIYELLMPAVLALVFGRFVLRYRQGERTLRWHLAGFSVFFFCVMVEVLAANRVFAFLSLADLGMLAVVLPLTIQLVERLTFDTQRLGALSGQLAGEVQQRTEERDRAETALVETEQLAALGRLAAGVGHEINNPLTYLQLALDEVETHIIDAGAPVRVREAVDHARDGAERIQKVVEGLRSYSRRQDERHPVDVRDVAGAALKVARPHLRHVARVETEFADVPRVLGDEPRLVQALVNLLINASQAVEARGGGAGSIVVSTARGSGDEVVLSVADDGAGIAPEHLARLTEPYYTTRARDGGLGLGLFVTQGIVDTHGGRLEVNSQVGAGTSVRIVLPGIAASLASTAEPLPIAQTPPGRLPAQPAFEFEPGPEAAPPAGSTGAASAPVRRRLLVVDDEPLVASFLKSGLQPAWSVACATNAADALQLLASHQYDAMVCDLMMPGMSGMELADELAASRPSLRARMVFLTGGAVTAAAEQFLGRPDVVYLTKPVRLKDLDGALRRLVSDDTPLPAADVTVP